MAPLFFSTRIENFLTECRAVGISETDLMSIRALVGEAYDRVQRPSPPETAATTAPGTPAAIRRTGSSQRLPAIRLEDEPDDD